jgi:syntaxin 7
MSFQDFDGSSRRPSATTKASSSSGSGAASQYWDEGPTLHMAVAESEYDSSVAIARGNISQMVSNVSVIRRLQGMLGTAKDTPEHRSRLHLSIEQTKKLAQDTRSLLHRMGSMGGYQDTGDSSQRHEQRKLGDDLQRVLKSFRDAATESLKRERSTCAAAKEHSWSNSDEEKVGLLETSKQLQMMQVASDLEFNEAMIAEREQGIQEVEKAVREVNEIFKDLSLIVSQQGEQVRRSLPRLPLCFL